MDVAIQTQPAFQPYPLTGQDAWIGSDMARTPEQWSYVLSSGEIEDLENAATQYLSFGKDIGRINKDTFPLGLFSEHLAQLKQKLLHGNGIELIRGLNIHQYSQEMIATIFCGIGAHLGSARSQNAEGHILGHVKDTGAHSSNPDTRIYQTSERQTFHTDSADIVGLMCIREAREGGDSLLVSATTIFNKICERRPDLARKLFENIATDRRGEIPEGSKPYMEIPPLNWYKNKLTVFYQRQYIDSAQRFPDTMRLNSDHVAALDLFDELANDTELHLRMRLQPGDIQFVYNHSQLHDRTGFVDWPEPERRRHLLRLWLSPDGDRLLPPCFRQRYGSIEAGKRGGIITNVTRLHAPLT